MTRKRKLASVSNALAVVDYLYTPDRLDAGYVITLSNGTTVRRELVRDSSRRALVAGIATSANGLEVESLDYGYDADSRPVARNADRFGYNVRGEVTFATIGGTDSIYGYDEIGNSTNWTANCLNQYTHCAYDADGNMTQYGDWTYAYDSMNRLATVSSNGVLFVTNAYDARSRRVRKVTPEATTTFFYDDWNLIEERVAYTNGTASTIHYYWGNDLSGTLQGAGGVGGLLYLTVDGAMYIPCYDNNGNIMRYLDASGTTVAAYTYDAFGNSLTQEGSMSEYFRHRFSTKYFDAESKLYSYGYRFYNGNLMRWMNRDPIGNSGGLNIYAICRNAPCYRYDIFGLYVNIDYDVSKKTLTARDADSGMTITLKEKVFSGNGRSCCVKADQWKKEAGPLPTGKYLIGLSYVPKQHAADSGDYNWYRLYGSNGKGGYSYNQIPVKAPDGTIVYRGGFNLHTGRASDGCVTVWSDVKRGAKGYPHSDDYDKLKTMLDKTKPLQYRNSSYTGWLEVK